MALATAAPIVELTDLVKVFDGQVRALDGLDLTVARGEFLAINGASGAGKSTLLQVLAAIDTPDSGRVVVDGVDLTRVRHPDHYRRQEIGLVFQLHNLLPQLNARQNVELPMIGTHPRRTRKERAAQADELLAAVQLAGKELRRPPELSGGERQRVAIARALANSPALLLADEPTGNLDSGSADAVIELFERIRRERDVTIVMVTHDPRAAKAADRVVTMLDGRIVDPAEAGDAAF
ncbi:MAG: transporter ATP-binding protein [Actinomycetia bacterium]|nr:transporter ATP-binding protein [Actinomycetes bacterium]